MNFFKKHNNILLIGNSEFESLLKQELVKSKYNPKIFLLKDDLEYQNLLTYIETNKINLVINLTNTLSSSCVDILRKNKIKVIGVGEKFLTEKADSIRKKVPKIDVDDEFDIISLWNGKKIIYTATVENYRNELPEDNSENEIGAYYPSKIQTNKFKMIQKYNRQMENALIAEKANFKGIICSSFSKNKNVIYFGVEKSICSGIAVFSYIFSQLKGDILDFFYKSDAISENPLPDFEDKFTGVIAIYGDFSEENIKLLIKKELKVYFNLKEKFKQKKRIIIAQTSLYPFANIYNELEHIEMKDIQYNENVGFPNIYNEKFCKTLPENEYVKYLKKIYKSHIGSELNIDNPKRFTEKIQWLKLNDKDPFKTLMTDKIKVKKYIQENIPELKVAELYGSWSNFDEIDFAKLPETFILKTNHSCKTNVKIFKKSKLLKSKNLLGQLKKFYEYHLNINFGFCSGFELQYKDIEPKIFAEELIELSNNSLTDEDYKIHCFNGIPKFIEHLIDCENMPKIFIADENWKQIKISHTVPLYDSNLIAKPKNLELMFKFARKLANNFKYVRCDFFQKANELYFAEMTFTPSSGFMNFAPEKIDYEWGELIEL